MTFHTGLFVHPDGDDEGTTPVGGRLALDAFIAAGGIASGLAVTGTSGWSYNIASGTFMGRRSAAGGHYVFANDDTVAVATDPAPGSNSRIDRVWVKPNDPELGDADATVEVGVAIGVPASTPAVPTLPTGAFELARFTVPSTATSTAHASVAASTASVSRAALRTPDSGWTRTGIVLNSTNAETLAAPPGAGDDWGIRKAGGVIQVGFKLTSKVAATPTAGGNFSPDILFATIPSTLAPQFSIENATISRPGVQIMNAKITSTGQIYLAAGHPAVEVMVGSELQIDATYLAKV